MGIDGPDEGHAVGEDEVEFLYGFGKFWIVASEGGDVGVGGFDGVGAFCGGGFFQDP